MKKIILVIVPMIVTAGIAGCGLEKQKKSSHRTIPSEYVEGSFVIEAASDDSNKLAAAGRDVGAALGCKSNDPERINWGSKTSPTSVSSESLENTFSMRFEGCDFTRDGTASILEKLGSSDGILDVQAEAIAAASPINENDRLKSRQSYLKLIERDEGCTLLPGQSSAKPIIVADSPSSPDLAALSAIA